MKFSPHTGGPLPPLYERALLQRYHNGRSASFDVDKLLPVFDPFHRGIVDEIGTVPLHFPGYPNQYELRLGADAVARRVLLTLEIRLPILAPGFWFCISCLMAEDCVALIAPTVHGIFYTHLDTPRHAPRFDDEEPEAFACCMTRIANAAELVALFAASHAGG